MQHGVSRSIIASSRLLQAAKILQAAKMVTTSKYKYHDDWQVSAQWDCDFWVTTRRLRDAIWIAAMISPYNSHITVHADCEHAGVKATAHVGLSLKEIYGKSIKDILELFDKEVDEYIACRVKTGHWGKKEGA